MRPRINTKITRMAALDVFLAEFSQPAVALNGVRVVGSGISLRRLSSASASAPAGAAA